MSNNFRSDTYNIFYSKIDAWLIIVFALAAIAIITMCETLYEEAKNSSSLESLLFVLLFLLFEIVLFLLIADAFIRCRYIFKENYLYIQSGIFVCTEIPYVNIKSFCESNDILSAPACSLDRIKIVYKNKKTGKESFTLVSPRNKQMFMEKLGAMIEANE